MSSYQVGQLISPRYRIVAALSRGAMGAVYKAEQVDTGTVVALKVVREQLAERDDIRERFEREAKAILALKHPNIVAYSDHGHDEDGRPFIVMELLDGFLANELITAEEPLTPAEAVHVIEQLCGALAVAHRQSIVHRDLKWTNVMVLPRPDDPYFIKLIDFGILKYSDEQTNTDRRKLTRAGVLLGTPDYVSPEQILGHQLDGRSDQYAVGVMTYELLTRKRPFSARTKADLLMCHMSATPQPMAEMEPPFPIPPGVEAAVLRSLGKQTDERFDTIVQFAHALRAGLTGPSERGDGAGAGSSSGGLRGWFRKLSGRG